MTTLGERLKKEREARGVSLEEVALATRINITALRALEKDDYKAISAPVFITGFLRGYANHLGLDADKIVAEFGSLKITMPKETVPKSLHDYSDNTIPIVVAVGFVLLATVGYIGYLNWPASVAEDTVAVVEEKPLVEPVPAEEVIQPVEETAGGKVEEEVAEPEAVSKPEPEPPKNTEKPKPAPVALKPVVQSTEAETELFQETIQKRRTKYRMIISADKQDVWVLVVVDDEIIHDMFVRAGQRIIMRADESFNFTTGNAAHVMLTINGKPIDVPVPRSNVIYKWTLPLPKVD